MVRLVGTAFRRVQQSAYAQELAPRAGRRARVDAAFDRRQARVGFLRPLREHERLGSDEFGLEAFGRRRAFRVDDGVGEREGLFGPAAPVGEAGGDDAHRPLVPAARLAAVVAEGLGGAGQVFGRAFVVAAHERDLRERVVDGARDLVRAQGRGLRRDLERAAQRRLGGGELPELDVDLAERGE